MTRANRILLHRNHCPKWPVKWCCFFLVLCGLTFSGCTVQLAPSYDEFIDQKLTELNQEIATFVAGVPEAGYPPDTYADHEQFYASTLGEIQALKARAAARPVPQPLVARWLGGGERTDEILAVGENMPTVESLGIVAEAIEDMRAFHRGPSGLSAASAEQTGRQIQVAMNNAIAYELALKR